MAVFKCKMCGGTIEFEPGSTVGVCDSCGTKQTLPRLDDDRKANLYDRANHFRRNNDFDKAMGIYETILNDDNKDAEAYWSLVLCRYGIEYVEDPETHKRIPTVNRAQYTSVFSDEDYKSALKYADGYQREIYEQEARAIDEIQKGILEISRREEPFDCFISFKETDANGRRTRDAVLAQELYNELTKEGFKVFFAPVTLEDKLGTAYEPYIFAALNSSKVMVVLGTKPENFNAVWVKNEWSRYLALIKNGAKKTLIPAYRDMDPYDLPEEFSHLMAQDMSKLGFMQDLIRGIKKLLADGEPKQTVKETVVVQSGGSTSANAQIKRGNMALEDHDWAKADSFFEEALNLDPECAEAYIGKLLAKEKMPDFDRWINAQIAKYSEETFEALEACPESTEHIDNTAKEMAVPAYLTEETIKRQYNFDRKYNSSFSCRQSQKKTQLNELLSERLLSRAKQYAKGETKKRLDDGLTSITEALDKRIDEARQNDNEAIERIKAAYAEHVAQADRKARELHDDAANRREQYYQDIVARMRSASSIPDYEGIIKDLKKLEDYKDSNALVEQCRKKIKAKTTKRNIILIAIATLCIAFVFVLTQVIIPNSKYNTAVELMERGEYEEAITAFEALNGYKDSAEQIEKCYVGKYGKEKWEEIKNIKAGDTYIFGAYEQDNDTANGKEDIEWLVLDRQYDKILIISKYGLDAKPYNKESVDITWEKCTLRSWLNGDFYNAAFNADEKKAIVQTEVSADKNPEYSTNPGNDTTDNVFLLSINEVNKYFSSDSERQCAATDYAIAQGAYTNSDYKVDGGFSCWWLLRSPGNAQYIAANVNGAGSVDLFGNHVFHDDDCVRPALWINVGA
jgi:hypothetical protein